MISLVQKLSYICKIILQLIEPFFYSYLEFFFFYTEYGGMFLLRYYYTVTILKKEIHRMTNCHIAFTVCYKYYNIIHTRERG